MWSRISEKPSIPAAERVRIGPEVADPPTVLGVEMRHVPSGNRYGIEPDGFYQRHLWLYDRNPAGLFADWNPTVSCRGTGDGARRLSTHPVR